MVRLAVLCLALASAACTETASFRGPAVYVVSAAGSPSVQGAFEQAGVVCAKMLAGKVAVRLGDACVLYATPSRAGHAATIDGGQRCTLPLPTPREVLVRTGTLFADEYKGVDVTIGASFVDAPETYVAYRLEAGRPRMGGREGCDAVLDGASKKAASN